MRRGAAAPPPGWSLNGGPPGKCATGLRLAGSGVGGLDAVVALPGAGTGNRRRLGLAELLLNDLAGRYLKFPEPPASGRHDGGAPPHEAAHPDQAADANQDSADNNRRAVQLKLAR